jgi:uncharacterized protein YbjT (DUF2867 family)
MSSDDPRRLFIAGSTGAVGRALTRVAAARGVDAVAHRRPKSGEKPGPGVFPLSDLDALAAALGGRTTVIQLIGTMRKRFAAGDTYETSDIGTTRQLADGAKRARSVDHFILLSSVGAGKPMGAYLKAKAEAEAIVRASGIAWTVFRPSAFAGEGHKPPPGMAWLTGALGLVRYQPIRVEDLAAAILRVALERQPLEAVLEGKSLWDVVSSPSRP